MSVNVVLTFISVERRDHVRSGNKGPRDMKCLCNDCFNVAAMMDAAVPLCSYFEVTACDPYEVSISYTPRGRADRNTAFHLLLKGVFSQ